MDKLAVVTGASSGIGESYAKRLAHDGWNLIVIARRLERLEALAKLLGSEHDVEVQTVQADLGSHADLERVCADLESLPVDLLVNNAALAHYMPFAKLSAEQSQELVQLNVLAPVRLTGAVLPGMREQSSGAIINVASLLAFSGSVDNDRMPQRAVYAATKSFLVTFTQILATELKHSGVKIKVVRPGIVRTEFHSRQGMDMSAVERMDADDVVRASFIDLDCGVVVSLPGVADEHIVDSIGEASAQVLSFTRVSELPERYSKDG